MKKTVIVFSLVIIAVFILLRISKYSYLSGITSIEMTIAVIAIVFFFAGIYLHKKSLHKKQPNTPKTPKVNYQKIKELHLSKREYEVLCEMAKGLSNREIADVLFVSESTIKTHISNIFSKLDAKRRTQAIQISKELQILPF